jgi:hypothetical protein
MNAESSRHRCEDAGVETDRCPDCGSPVFEAGSLTKDGRPVFPLKFTPSWRWRAFLRWNKWVDVWEGLFYSCSSCGPLWSRIDPQRLRSYIERYGPSEAKLALARFSKPQGGDDLA